MVSQQTVLWYYGYKCTSSWVIYLVTCTACKIQYVGQTRQEMRQRHYGHRSDIKNGIAGLGSHFKEVHGNNLDLKKNRTWRNV